MPQPDISEQAKLQQLLAMLGGSKDKTKINLGNPGDFLSIDINGIPYELAIPCIITMLTGVMKYAETINNMEEKTDVSTKGSVDCSIESL